MRRPPRFLAVLLLAFSGIVLAHFPFLHLPYFWDEAGYYIPAALDFYHHGWLIPRSTLPTGHTPLVMAYLAAFWRLFGFSTAVSRVAMILVAAITVVATYDLGRQVFGREAAVWAAILLALSPLFFAQSSLVFLDLAAACFTALSLLFLLEERWLPFALCAVMAVMSKETAAVMLPIVWGLFLRRKERRAAVWMALAAPALALAVWAVYYRHVTGFWTGNAEYLQYNLYSALAPAHVLRSFVARTAEIFIQGFNWVLTAGAIAGFVWARRHEGAAGKTGSLSLPWHPVSRPRGAESFSSRKAGSRLHNAVGSTPSTQEGQGRICANEFRVLAGTVAGAYIVMLSLIGGAVLARYMLPVIPLFILFALTFVSRLPRRAARVWLLASAGCFIASWFINPPYPFPYENNLSYVDFVRLHQAAARYLESLPGNPVILTAWPATDELRQPPLGYVTHPLRVASIDDFAAANFSSPPPFDVLYLYSRKWEPKYNLLTRIGALRHFASRFYGYSPQVSARKLAARYHLKLLQEFKRRGQWVSLYARQ
jgi:4-amino-4-deoxy-L-arabinose transferase-like glycosyltransferase